MKRKKPDAMVLLSVLFGLGILISTITYGSGEQIRDYENQKSMGLMVASETAASAAER